MKINSELSVIIVHYGSTRVTNKTLGTLKIQIQIPLKFFIIDNSQNFRLQNELSGLKYQVLTPAKNIGYAAALNFGYEAAVKENFKNFIFMNNDVVIPNNFLNSFINTIPSNRLAISTPLIKYYSNKNKIWYNGGYINYYRMEGMHFDIDKNEKDNSISKRTQNVSFVSGCFFFTTAEVMGKVGKFNEYYFLYYEDLDFSLRAINKDIQLFHIPSFYIYHEVSSNTGSGSKLLKFNKVIYYYRIRNKIIIIRKYAKGFNKVTASVFLIAKIIKHSIVFFLSLKLSYERMLFKSIKDGLTFKY